MDDLQIMADEDGLLPQLARLQQQLVAVNQSIEEIKTSVRGIASLDKTVGELTVKFDQSQKNEKKQWEKIDESHDEIDKTNEKVSEYITKANVIYRMCIYVLGILYTLVIGFLSYNFVHLRAIEDSLLIINHKMEQQEKGRLR
jgi:vacuolar-type H+-ATPase subunit I/STV1